MNGLIGFTGSEYQLSLLTDGFSGAELKRSISLTRVMIIIIDDSGGFASVDLNKLFNQKLQFCHVHPHVIQTSSKCVKERFLQSYFFYFQGVYYGSLEYLKIICKYSVFLYGNQYHRYN